MIREPLPIGTVVAAGGLAAAAANAKYQVLPMVVVAWVLLVIRLGRDARWGRLLVAWSIALPLILATPIKNAIEHWNPFYHRGVARAGSRVARNGGAIHVLTALARDSNTPRTVRRVSAPLATAAIGAITVAIVAWSTHGVYLYRKPESFSALLRAEVDSTFVDRIPAEATVCIDRPPWTFLYAAPFHGRNYLVREGVNCDSAERRQR